MPSNLVREGVWVCINRHVQERHEHPRSMPVSCRLDHCGTSVRPLTDPELAAYLIGGSQAVQAILPPLMVWPVNGTLDWVP